MTKRVRNTQPHLADTASLRVRAAWLYYNRRLTQQDIADKLGISRSTVIRLLDEARRRAEVQIWINTPAGDCATLASDLEARFGLAQAIVVPGSGTPQETAQDVGAALGQFLSAAIADDQVIGVGWGRTLSASLQTFRPQRREGVRVVALQGGLVQAKLLNPIDFSWRMASILGAECLLFLAPVIVDSADTKRRLIEDCGLDTLLAAANALDLAVISCGDIGPGGSSLSQQFVPVEDQRGLIAAGAICDTMCHFLNSEGLSVDHPFHARVMSVGLEAIARARHIVLASGGAARAAAIRATILRTGCHTLITDEAAAEVLMTLPGSEKTKIGTFV